MTPERWARVQEIFISALERKASDRAAFLSQASGDPETRREVESLLAAHEEASSQFLESPAIGTLVPAVLPRRSLARGTRLGSFEIVASLGAGGMGEVYRARDTKLGRDVAVKVLPAEVSADPERVKRFEKEARSASALNHPNIITIHDSGTSDGVSWIAMELVEGQTLRQLVASGPLPVKRLLPFAAQIAEGLAKAHEGGIVHRDLKPENIMVTRDGLVKILDFGLAKLSGPVSGSGEHSHLPTLSGTSPGLILGTVGYMSPEQAAGAPVDYRSDQFSFGSILYEMATGRRAFQKKTAVDTLSAILNEEPEPVESLNPEAPAPLRWILERCLAKEPRQRYSATDDLARDLTSLREHLTEMSTTGAAASARLWSSPTRIVAALAGLALLPVIGYVGATLRTRPISQPAFTKVTFQRGTVWRARFSPDARTVVYAMHSVGRDLAPPRIFSASIGRLDMRSLDVPPADVLSISAGGQLAISLASPPFDFGRGTLAEVPLAGGTPRQIFEGVTGADWSPDGKQLAVTREINGKMQLEYPVGKVLYEGARLAGPRVSPDGQSVAFVEGSSGTLEALRLVGLDRRIRTLREGIGGWVAWSPHGNEIWWIQFFTGTRANGVVGSLGQNSEIHSVDLNLHERVVATLPGDFFLQDLSAGGRLLVERNQETIEMAATLPGQAERNLEWLDQSFPVELSSDLRTLLFTDRGDPSGAGTAVYLRGTDGAAAVRIGDGAALALSPDKKWALASRGTNNPQIVLIPTGAGQEKVLPIGPLEFGGWASFHPDGKSIFFSASEPGHRVRAYQQDLEDGSRRAVGPEGFAPSLLSPDGTRFLMLDDRGQEISVASIGGDPDERPRVVTRLPARVSPVHWNADGRSVLIWELFTSPIRVDRLDLTTGERTLWRLLAPGGRMGVGGLTGLAVSPNEDAWVAGYHRWFSELLVVDGLR